MKPEILYFKNLKYAYWRLEAVVEVVDRREGDDFSGFEARPLAL